MSLYRPPGVVARSTPDYLARAMMSAGINNSGQLGAFTYAVLFNNSTIGENLWIYGLTAGISFTADPAFSGQNQIAYGWIAGNPAGVDTAGTPLRSDQPVGAGLVGSFNGLFTESGSRLGYLQSTWEGARWPYDYPCCVLPPNYSFWVEPIWIASDLVVSLQWLPLQDTK